MSDTDTPRATVGGRVADAEVRGGTAPPGGEPTRSRPGSFGQHTASDCGAESKRLVTYGAKEVQRCYMHTCSRSVMDFTLAFILQATLLTGLATGQRYIGVTLANVGASTTLGCQIADMSWNSNEAFQVTWKWAPRNSVRKKHVQIWQQSKSELQVQQDFKDRLTRVSKEGYKFGDFSLNISKVRRDDSGIYTCHVKENSATRSYVTHLYTDEEFATRTASNNIFVRASENKNASLPCDLSNIKPQQNRGVSWFLHGDKRQISKLYFERFMYNSSLYKAHRHSERIEVPLKEFENNVFSLQIDNINKDDFGVYTCFVYDGGQIYERSVRLYSEQEPMPTNEDILNFDGSYITSSSSSPHLTTPTKQVRCPLLQCLVPSIMAAVLVAITLCIIITVYTHRWMCKDYCKAKKKMCDPEKVEMHVPQSVTGVLHQESQENDFTEISSKPNNNQPTYMPMSSPVNRPATYENMQRMAAYSSNTSDLAKTKHSRAKRPRQARRCKNKNKPPAPAAAAAASSSDTTTAPPVPIRHQSKRRPHQSLYSDLQYGYQENTVYSCINAPSRTWPGESCGNSANEEEERLGPAGGELLYSELDHDVATTNRAASDDGVDGHVGLALEDNELYGAVP
ncbi:unnamed protein product [Lampetra fluviatilis]